MTIEDTLGWFEKAVPHPTARNLTVQVGCHLEEVAEMLDAMIGVSTDTQAALLALKIKIEEFGTHLKSGAGSVMITDRKEFLDGITDQTVTAVGCGHMANMSVPQALERVNASNYSKFVDGKPLFDENGKIKKGPDYHKPDLKGLY